VQSIIVFGVLTVASAMLSWIPFFGGFFGAVIGILTFICWIVLMIKAYQDELYKFPLAGDIAESIIPIRDVVSQDKPHSTEEEDAAEPIVQPKPPVSPAVGQEKQLENRLNKFFTNTRAGRITSSSFTIAWSFILLVFFSFFHGYIAYYQSATIGSITTWIREPLVTREYYTWLPILIVTLLLSIAGHIILIIHDRYWLRQIILILLNMLGIVTVATLVSIFPFAFYVIPSNTVADIVSVSVRITLIAVAIGFSIGTLVMFIKLIINLVKVTTD